MELTTKEKKHLWYLKNKEKNKEHKDNNNI